jgi:addiction module RelE/StbE family toxin
MKIRFHKDFEKRYEKLTEKEQEKTRGRIGLFLENPFDLRLNNHPLKGKYTDYRSINITGDIRAVYKLISEKECIFVIIGRHGNLYS